MHRLQSWLIIGWGLVILLGLPAYCELQIGEGQIADGNKVKNIAAAQKDVVLHNPLNTIKAKAQPPAVKAELDSRIDDIVDFLNGDKLHGDLVALNMADGQLQWRHKGVKEPISFQMTGLARVDLLPRKAAAQTMHANIVQLANGDQLRGDVATLDTEKLVLNTWYAGTLSIRRDQLALIQPASKPNVTLYEGPTDDLAGWETSNDAGGNRSWVGHKGVLTPGEGHPLGRHITNMPDMVQIEFDVSMRFSSSFSFSFFLQDPKSYGGDSDAYMLNFSGDNVQLNRMVRREGSQNLGSVQLGTRHSGRKHELFTLLADRKERRFALLLEGRLVREWKDPQEFKGPGDGIMFMAHQHGAIQISKIKVSRWEGKLPRSSNETAAASIPASADTLEFINGDTLTGKVRSISKGNIKFETSYATLDVPMERAINIRFAVVKPAATNTNLAPDEIRAWFSKTEPLTLKQVKVQNGELSGINLGCGPLRVPLSAFLLLDFNLGAKRTDPDSDL